MAIGTTVKVGFDGNAVSKGLASLTGKFRALGGVVGRMGRQVAIGGARRTGATLIGLISDIVMSIPNKVTELETLSASIRNIARDSSMAESEVIAMMKALELSGMNTDLAADTFREFATKMGEAMKEVDSEPMKALMDLGIFQNDIKGRGLGEQIQLFADAIKNFKGSQQDLAFIMDRFLGGDLGLRAISFFQDYNSKMEEGRRLTDNYSKQMVRATSKLQELTKLKSVISQKFAETILASINLNPSSPAYLVKKLENLDISGYAEKLAPIMQGMIEDPIGMFRKAFEWLREEAKKIGNYIGQGIKESLGLDKGIMGLFSQSSATPRGGEKLSPMMASIEANTRMTTDMLRQIYRNPKPAVAV